MTETRVTIKIKKSDKERLDRLRALLTLKGQKITQEELLSQLIKNGEQKILESLREKKVANHKKDNTSLLDLEFDLPILTSEEMDELLYPEK